MRTLLVTVLVLAHPALGADFRGTEFGSSCAAIEEREKARGSASVPIQTTGEAYRFNGRAFDRDVLVTYLCKDGAFSLGDYHFKEGKYEDSVADYLAAYNFLVSVYGSPSTAYARHGGMASEIAVPPADAMTRDEYHAYWKLTDLAVHVDLVTYQAYEKDNWHTMVIMSSTRNSTE